VDADVEMGDVPIPDRAAAVETQAASKFICIVSQSILELMIMSA